MNVLSERAQRLVVAFCAILFVQRNVDGHVDLAAPIGGEVLEVGISFPIGWVNTVSHNTENWDLWYSTTSAVGPWTDIVIDLPVGATFDGSRHAYSWLVPNKPSDNAWIRVRQDNGGEDYESISPMSFEIAASAALPADFDNDGDVDGDDFLAWQASFGLNAGGDADGDGDTDGDDFLAWQSEFGSAAGNVSSSAVPEPTAIGLAFVGNAVFLAVACNKRSNRLAANRVCCAMHPCDSRLAR